MREINAKEAEMVCGGTWQDDMINDEPGNANQTYPGGQHGSYGSNPGSGGGVGGNPIGGGGWTGRGTP